MVELGHMRYDFYDRGRIYKPGLALRCRDRLHSKVLQGGDIHSVLEIGVGFGEFADYCRRNGIEYVGIEPNAKLRTALTEKGFRIYNATLPNYPEIGKTFDAIFAAHLIEHLNGLPEVLEFLSSTKKVLKSHQGRYLILLYPDIEKCGWLFFHDYTHTFVTTKKRVEEMLFDHGWDIVQSVRYTACFFMFSGLISMVGKLFPYWLLPEKVALFARLSFLQHCATIATPL